MKQLSIAVFGFLLLLLLIPVTSLAESADVFEVGDIKLNVRSEPSNRAEIIGQLEKGNRVMVFEERYGWAKTFYGGEEAWVAAHFVTPVNDSGQISAQASVKVTAQGVHIRSGPGTDHSIIGFTTTGNTYSLIESAGNWHKVTLEDGSSGWIAGWLTNAGVNNETSSETDTNDTVNNTEENTSNTNNEAVAGRSTNRSLAGYNIVLDPGHGGKDPGAVVGALYEKDLITQTADNVAQKLRDEGATVILTRSGDYFVSLDDRVRISEEYNTHAFVSLHYDAFPLNSINGVSTYFNSNADRELANAMQSSLSSNLPLHNRGIMQGNYRVLRHNPAPSVILELGFMSNSNDLAVIQTESYHNSVAEAVAAGLKKYLND